MTNYTGCSDFSHLDNNLLIVICDVIQMICVYYIVSCCMRFNSNQWLLKALGDLKQIKKNRFS